MLVQVVNLCCIVILLALQEEQLLVWLTLMILNTMEDMMHKEEKDFTILPLMNMIHFQIFKKEVTETLITKNQQWQMLRVQPQHKVLKDLAHMKEYFLDLNI